MSTDVTLLSNISEVSNYLKKDFVFTQNKELNLLKTEILI